MKPSRAAARGPAESKNKSRDVRKHVFSHCLKRMCVIASCIMEEGERHDCDASQVRDPPCCPLYQRFLFCRVIKSDTPYCAGQSFARRQCYRVIIDQAIVYMYLMWPINKPTMPTVFPTLYRKLLASACHKPPQFSTMVIAI